MPSTSLRRCPPRAAAALLLAPLLLAAAPARGQIVTTFTKDDCAPWKTLQHLPAARGRGELRLDRRARAPGPPEPHLHGRGDLAGRPPDHQRRDDQDRPRARGPAPGVRAAQLHRRHAWDLDCNDYPDSSPSGRSSAGAAASAAWTATRRRTPSPCTTSRSARTRRRRSASAASSRRPGCAATRPPHRPGRGTRQYAQDWLAGNQPARPDVRGRRRGAPLLEGRLRRPHHRPVTGSPDPVDCDEIGLDAHNRPRRRPPAAGRKVKWVLHVEYNGDIRIRDYPPPTST